ncbi:MAG: PAS domain S-box protein, partial [Spirochaetaceae bacterium]|nr:PAS domain S-box protein [Spirochaetaceae bacterium]
MAEMDDRDIRIRELERRLDRLAKEKAKSQLLSEVMRSFRAAATFEEILQSIINNALIFHGGMSVRLYYNLGSHWHLHDLDGDKGFVEICENPMLEEVLGKKTYVEQLEEAPQELFNDTHQDMQKHTGLCASGIPLMVNGSIIAVLELRGRMLYDFEFQEEFDIFFSYSGIVLQNAILNSNALSEMESEYRQIFESYNDGVMVLDQSYRIRRVNGMMCRLLGMGREQMSGLSALDLAVINNEAECWLKEPRTNDSIYSSDTVFLNPKTQAQQYCIIIIGILKDSDDRPAGYIVGLKDIRLRVQAAEDLRVSEERLRLAMKGSNDGLW